MATRKEGSSWCVDINIGGRKGKRIREFGFKTQSLAKQREKKIKSDFAAGKGVKEGERLSDLIDRWYDCHGRMLKDAKTRYARTLAIASKLGNPLIGRFSASHFNDYRTQRLTEVSISTVNHETRYLRSVFNEMKRLGEYEGQNPLSLIRTYKEPHREMGYLTGNQIELLLESCRQSRNNHTEIVSKICLVTGARWGEANGLCRKHLDARNNRVRFVDTKNGSSRTVPIPEDIKEAILEIAFPESFDRLFDDCKSAFRSAVKRSGLQLPQGQMTHILRHTFASHFMMNGGDIITLQRILGHGDLKMTMRYAHLAPDYLDKSVKFNPLNFPAI